MRNNALDDIAAMQERRLQAAQGLRGRLRMRLGMTLKRGVWLAVIHSAELFKRVFDITVSIVALILAAPLMLFIALLVRLDGGPVFFKQRRVGLNGREFGMLKFRSMCVDAEARLQELLAKNEKAQGVTFKMKNDPRITPIGRIIRKFSIDELPQLINILRGDMTIVGPRPAVPREVALYKVWQRRRLSVRPGLTCYWQVSGRNEIGFDEWMQLDLKYVDNWNLKIDFELILKTFPVVLTGRGAS